MDDIGLGEGIAKIILTIFDLSFLTCGLFFAYAGVKRSYILPVSVLLNIASSHYFEINEWGLSGFINLELWPFVNFILLIYFIVQYGIHRSDIKKASHFKKKKNRWKKWVFGTTFLFLAIWLLLVFLFFTRIMLIILGLG